METVYSYMKIQKFGEIYLLISHKVEVLFRIYFFYPKLKLRICSLFSLFLDGHKAEMLPSGSFRARRDDYGGELERLHERDLDCVRRMEE